MCLLLHNRRKKPANYHKTVKGKSHQVEQNNFATRENMIRKYRIKKYLKNTNKIEELVKYIGIATSMDTTPPPKKTQVNKKQDAQTSKTTRENLNILLTAQPIRKLEYIRI